MSESASMTSKVPLYLLSGTLGLCAGFAVSGEMRGADVEFPKDLRPAHSIATSQRIHSEAEKNRLTAYGLRIVSEGMPTDAYRFIQYFDQLHPDDQEHLKELMHSNMHDDPEKTGQFIQTLAKAFYDRDPGEALDFLAMFSRSSPIIDIERYLLADLIEKDPSLLRSVLLKWQVEELYGSEQQLQQIAAIYAEKSDIDLRRWIAWLGDLEPETHWDLYRGGFEALARYTNPDQSSIVLETLMPSISTDKGLWHVAGILIGQRARDRPEEAAAALAALPVGPWKDEALSYFLLEAGLHNPDVAVALLSAPGFLDTFAMEWEEVDEQVVLTGRAITQEASEVFFDRSLEYLLESAINSDPEVVLRSADSFYDPELQKRYREAANEVLERPRLSSGL